jgi:uncharacterized membrane protein (UPF0127 family)
VGPALGSVLTALVALAVGSCGSDGPEVPPGAVRATLGDVPLVLEVADSPQERATGLMRREEVPPGTGMIFYFDEPVQTKFYMFDVPVPLKAVFVREGEVVHSVVMPPCEEPEPGDCPLYGPHEPFDTVVETAPETLPDVQPGDRLVVEG